MNRKPLFIALMTVALSAPALAGKDKHRHHDAHEHGVAQLNLVVDGSKLFIELESPAANIVGFEHKPQNAQQKEAIRQAVKTLRNGEALFLFNKEAGCSLVEAEVESELVEEDDHHHGHGHHDERNHKRDDHHDHDEESHAEFSVSYQFSCGNSAALNSVDVKLFEQFGNTEELQVQLITESSQGAVRLSSHNTVLKLK